MGFADAYLRKAGLRELLINTDPHPDLKIIVTIPVHKESGLERCLDSLFLCVKGGNPPSAETGHDHLPFHVEVLILVNASEKASEAVLEQNRVTLEATRSWIAGHSHPSIGFHAWMDHRFPAKEAGVGLARKILMDEAVRRFSTAGNPGGIIASLDADVVVDPNYLEALGTHFEDSDTDGCSIYFEHPLSPELSPFESFEPGVYDAITQYELHLRYYLNAVRSTGYPYAYHTVGSSFAVRADVYCKEGGMNRRQGGEDFYFIQKVAQRGNFSECNATRVVASPRPSDRVPFGTGPVVEKYVREQAVQTSEQSQLTTYHPEPFGMLARFFSGIDSMYGNPADGSATETTIDSSTGSAHLTQEPVLTEFLESQDFNAALAEIRGNSASLPAFRKRFWRWFNMFRIMKFLHYARARGYPDVGVGIAAFDLLAQISPGKTKRPAIHPGLNKMLQLYRQQDRSNQF